MRSKCRHCQTRRGRAVARSSHTQRQSPVQDRRNQDKRHQRPTTTKRNRPRPLAAEASTTTEGGPRKPSDPRASTGGGARATDGEEGQQPLAGVGSRGHQCGGGVAAIDRREGVAVADTGKGPRPPTQRGERRRGGRCRHGGRSWPSAQEGSRGRPRGAATDGGEGRVGAVE
jgi:hypothetical protein